MGLAPGCALVPICTSRFLDAEPMIELLSPAQFHIRMAEPAKVSQRQTSDGLDLIRGDIDVKNVQFTQSDITTNGGIQQAQKRLGKL
ncbi:MAG TPA: hypothetical protein V6C46_02185 [Coleofasciculaceae cyanobacterium]